MNLKEVEIIINKIKNQKLKNIFYINLLYF